MKTLPRLSQCALLLVAAFCLSANNCDRKHNVVFLPDYDHADQIILRGTEISDADAAQIMRHLKPSSVQGFYTIKPFDKDVAGPVMGKMPFPDCLLSHGFDSKEIGDEGFRVGISRGQFSRWTRVIGVGCVSRCNPQLTRESRKVKRASQDLVNAVKPILEKYQEKK
jgi:hypothetical protein